MDMVPVLSSKQANGSRNGSKNDDTFKDRAHLLRIFPEEVWGLVFEKFTDPRDLENVCNASLFFRHLLIPKQTLFLFPKVWNILEIKYHQSSSRNPFVNKSDDFEIDGVPIRDYYKECTSCGNYVADWWNAATLTFRLVCRTWNSAVESFYQAKPIGRQYDETYHAEVQTCTSHNTCFYFTNNNPGKIVNFMRHFDPSHFSGPVPRNPFPSRGIDLYLSDVVREAANQEEQEVNPQPPWNESSFASLLMKYGRHVWYCVLHADDVLEDYSRIRDVLEWMPNLKQLFFSSQYQNYTPSQYEIDVFTAQTIASPLATLPLLRFLYIDGVSVVFINELIYRHNQLEIIDVFDQHQELSMRPFQLPKLQDLFIELYTESEFLSLTSNPVSWPLKKLYLGLEGSDFMDWSVIFKKLEANWADTLTRLVLKLPEAPGESERNKIIEESHLHILKLSFTRITKLELVIQNICSLDIILPMKDSLEFLKLEVTYGAIENESKGFAQGLEYGQVIELFRHSNRLWESNVWTLFPKLKRVQLKEFYRAGCPFVGDPEPKYICTREDWNWKRRQLAV